MEKQLEGEKKALFLKCLRKILKWRNQKTVVVQVSCRMAFG